MTKGNKMDKDLKARAFDAALEGMSMVQLAEKIQRDMNRAKEQGAEFAPGDGPIMMEIPVDVMLSFGKTMENILNVLVENGCIDEAAVKKAAAKAKEDREIESAAEEPDHDPETCPGCIARRAAMEGLPPGMQLITADQMPAGLKNLLSSLFGRPDADVAEMPKDAPPAHKRH